MEINQTSVSDVTFRAVTPDTWPDFEALFEGRGGPKNCWCMVSRTTPEESRQRDKASLKAAMEQRIKGGTPVGILGYLDGEPVAWCSVAPRVTFPKLDGASAPRTLSRPQDGGAGLDDAGANVWSVTCFFVRSKLRGEGISRRLLETAIEHARSRGATVIEAYSVDPDSPSYRFGGYVPMFASLGFEEAGMLGKRRHRMRLKLD